VEQLKTLYAPYRVLVMQLDSADSRPIELHGAGEIRREGTKVWLRFDPAQVPVAALIAEVTRRYTVADLAIEEPELEQVVREIYQDVQVAS
jgi:ABC-2 type transport system ATP-binding protein